MTKLDPDVAEVFAWDVDPELSDWLYTWVSTRYGAAAMRAIFPTDEGRYGRMLIVYIYARWQD